MSNLPLFDPSAQPTAEITRLYEHLELFSEGEPPQHSLFILGRPTLAEHDPLQAPREQLLIVDPPQDITARFRLDGDVAVLHTGEVPATALPQVQTQAGGVAHIRVGAHFLDIYSQQHGNIVYLPTLGILCGGGFGSDVLVPCVGPTSDGSEELETLRLLAQLVKGQNFQMYIPHIGGLSQDRVAVMQRLAADVAYLHELRRVLSGLAERGESEEVLETIAATLLPQHRQSALSADRHERNMKQIYDAYHNGSALGRAV
ncbi:MAG TPA: hypothetical protein P5121_10670 [Caldilineaceae bacterium]|mgnify:CR=1 FL=1|nr:hypothetical protein [Caldilineaceae bacterium]